MFDMQVIRCTWPRVCLSLNCCNKDAVCAVVLVKTQTREYSHSCCRHYLFVVLRNAAAPTEPTYHKSFPQSGKERSRERRGL